jgi:nucleoside 2-deoxyribosyltransferase
VKLYLAALYSRRAEMEVCANFLKNKGFEITSSWVYGAEENEGRTREQNAIMDLGDVDKADIVVSFTHAQGTLTKGGGRHVEFGYAYAKGKKLVIIGDRENVFHYLPNVEVFPDLGTWLASRA